MGRSLRFRSSGFPWLILCSHFSTPRCSVEFEVFRFSVRGGYASKTKGKLLPDLDKLLASGGSKTPPIVDV